MSDAATQFDLEDFLPYLLNRAAERSSREFQQIYKSRYAMLRTEWRVLFHLGRYGEMTAIEVCKRGDLHKTKVSRAVQALEEKRFLKRTKVESDRRFELLALTRAGEKAYAELTERAEAFQSEITSRLSVKTTQSLMAALRELSGKSE